MKKKKKKVIKSPPVPGEDFNKFVTRTGGPMHDKRDKRKKKDDDPMDGWE